MPTEQPTFSHQHYATWHEITKPKRLFPETSLVQDGSAQAVLITPDRPAYRAQAQKIQQAIRERTGVVIPLHTDQEVDPWQTPRVHQILLGNLMDNRMVAPLYAQRHIAADAHYPGAGGHVLRTVHDPWGNGCNVIFAGGSDIHGVATSVERLIDHLSGESANLWLPPLLDVQLTDDFLAQHPHLNVEPDDAFFEAQMAEAHQMLETSAHGGITDPLGRAGIYYHITGKIGWAKLFKQLAFLMYEDFQKGREQYGGPWGMDADFRLYLVLPAWDLVEEAPIFSDDERLKITHIFAQFIEDAVPHAADAVQHRRTRHNHWTYAALGLLFSAQYFAKYYGIQEADDWLYVADECFIPQCHSARSHENSNGYQWLTLSHALTYALARPYPAFFEEGHVRTICDLAIVSMDNLGYQSAYGDTQTIYGWGTEFPILAAAAWYYGDGRYQWALEQTNYDPSFRIGVRSLGAYRSDVEPVEPSELTGVVALPLDPAFHYSFDGAEVLPAELAYDKVAFRPDFDSESEYLLLDGLAVGGHKHYDCNAIIRLTALSRLWLADGDYYCSAPNFHNGVLPLCDGRTTPMPPFTWREHVADLPSSGFSRTVVKEYGNTDWARNILWRKGQYFLVADVMRARASNEYDFCAQWRVIGEVELEGERLTIQQQDRRLEIINLDGASSALAVDTYTTAEWADYAHAEPVVTILRQTRSAELAEGEADVFLNLLHPYRETAEPLDARRISQGSILVQESEEVVWLGTRLDAPTQAPCATDAALWAITAGDFALVHATEFGCGDPLFHAEHPVDIEFDLVSGQAVVTADHPTLLTFYNLKINAGDAALRVDDSIRALRQEENQSEGNQLTFSVPPGRHAFALALAEQPTAVAAIAAALAAAWAEASPSPAVETAATANQETVAAKVDEPAWRLEGATFSAVAPVVDAPADMNCIAAGTVDGQLWLVDTDGAVRWRQQIGGAITTVVSADFGNGQRVIAAGSTDSTVTVFSLEGEQLWQFQVPFYKRDGIVRVLLAADLDGDGREEIIVGAENWHYYVLDQQGREQWHFESVHAATAGAVADIDHDGAPELIAATEYYWWFGVSNQGQMRWQHNTVQGPGVNHVATAAQPDGTHLVAFGCRDGTVQVVDAQGELQFVLRTADVITGLAAADIDDDGAEEFLVASAIQNSYALKADGSILWRRNHRALPSHLLVDGTGERPFVLVAEGDGHVQRLNDKGQTVSELWLGDAASALALLPTKGKPLLVAALSQGDLCAWRSA